MPAIEVGRICVKIAGRETGHKCVIVDVVDKNFILITGPKEISGIKRRRVNINHVEPTNDKIDLGRDSSDKDVVKALETAGKTETMKEAVKPLVV
jgi:large subunit ribosomal protein L14e